MGRLTTGRGEVFAVLGYRDRDYFLCRSLREVSLRTGLSYYVLRDRFRRGAELFGVDWWVFRLRV
jgi:hypothetical protein